METIKAFKEKNLTVNFMLSLKGQEIQLFYNFDGKSTHRKTAYSDYEIKNPKKGEKKTIKIENDNSEYILIVEQRTNRPNNYTIFIRYDMNMKELAIPENYIISKDLLDNINKYIREENSNNKKFERYSQYPEFVQKCIPFEDIAFFEESISKNKWYRNQFERLIILKYIIGSPLVKRWLSKIGVYTTTKKQDEMDNLALYIAKIFAESLPDLEKKIIYEYLNPYIKILESKDSSI